MSNVNLNTVKLNNINTLKIKRRCVLKSAALLGLSAPSILNASSDLPASKRRFLFLFAEGGWDCTQVFDYTDETDLQTRGCTIAKNSKLRWVSHPDRPQVDKFFHRWGHQVTVINGIKAHGLDHQASVRRMLTGSPTPSQRSWPQLLSARQSGLLEPLVELSGPRILEPHENLCVELSNGRQRNLETDFSRRSKKIDEQSTLYTHQPNDFTLFQTAVEILKRNHSRCVSLGIPGAWDSHRDRAIQGSQFANLFHHLDLLFHGLAQTPGHSATTFPEKTLLQETVVVVLSEFGRNPIPNSAGGKDHWPYVSAMVAGAGVAGGQNVGATNEQLVGQPIAFSTGLPSSSGIVLRPENLGAALLQLGGVKPSAHLHQVGALTAILTRPTTIV